MIPRRIQLTNFRAVEHANIDLTAITLAAISGPNGAGKSSSFTLAPVFALFGDKIKGIGMDDLVRSGAQEMAVTFEFEHNGKVYKVIRTRSRKGGGKSTLELQQQVGDGWISLSAEKIKDTEEVIRNLLNLDAETFTATSMILQGKANEFTAQTPGKRKDTLQQVLGLNIYDQLQQAAKERSAALHVEIEKFKDKLSVLDERLQQKLAKLEAQQQLQGDLESIRMAISATESDLRLQEDTIRDLQEKARRADDLSNQIATIDEEVAALQNEKTTLTAKLERTAKILSNAAAIAQKTEELQQVKEQIAGLEARLPEKERLKAEIKSIEASLNKIKADMEPIQHRMANIEQLLINRTLFAERAAEYQTASTDLQKLETLAQQWDVLEKEITDVRARIGAEEARISTAEQLLNAEIQTLEAKTIMLEDSDCIDVSRAACRFLTDAQEAKRLLVTKRAELAAIDRSQLDAWQTKLEEVTAKQRDLGYDYAAHRALKFRADELRPLAEQATQLEAKEELHRSLQDQLNQLLDQEREHSERYVARLADLSGLEEILSALPELRERATKLQAWANLKDELAAAQETQRNANERIAAIDQEVLNKTMRRTVIGEERAALLLQTINLEKFSAKVPELQAQLQQLRGQETRIVTRIGGLQAELAALEMDEQERDRIAAEMEPKSKEWAQYQTLVKAFGRDGIPALIIENAVPELERIANDILGKMSKGRHYVRFETQRDLKSRDGVAETLDIIIGDWTSERPYETFSGGEQLRIDYAIRFALAELLARRAGSKVEWLTIDEGLGSQDAEHRALVLESIKSVADRFKKVLVITHIEDAMTVFDQRIIFENRDNHVEVKVA